MAAADKLEQMLTAVEAELRGKQAAITAADITLSALRSAEKDLRQQLADLHAKLAAAKKEWTTVENARKFLLQCEKILGPA
jgi:chromosome segregation ATPase